MKHILRNLWAWLTRKKLHRWEFKADGCKVNFLISLGTPHAYWLNCDVRDLCSDSDTKLSIAFRKDCITGEYFCKLNAIAITHPQLFLAIEENKGKLTRWLDNVIERYQKEGLINRPLYIKPLVIEQRELPLSLCENCIDNAFSL